jgi:hypothetical protein
MAVVSPDTDALNRRFRVMTGISLIYFSEKTTCPQLTPKHEIHISRVPRVQFIFRFKINLLSHLVGIVIDVSYRSSKFTAEALDLG